MSSHADTIRRELEKHTPNVPGKAFEALDALLAENQQLREAIRKELEGLREWAREQNREQPLANAWAEQVEQWCMSRLGKLGAAAVEE
jgi:hypothetical protein